MFIDLVVGDAAPSRGGFWELAREKGIEHEMAYYSQRLEQVTIPNAGRLLAAFRAKEMEVIHGVSQAYAPDGRDRHRKSALKPQTYRWYEPGNDSSIIEAVAPQENEIVVAKTGTGFFGITVIDKILTNLGIENLVISGVVTHQCVESTVRGAFDHGFNVILAEDACASISDELHSASLRALGGWFCEVRSTQEILEEVARVEG